MSGPAGSYIGAAFAKHQAHPYLTQREDDWRQRVLAALGQPLQEPLTLNYLGDAAYFAEEEYYTIYPEKRPADHPEKRPAEKTPHAPGY